MNSDRPCSRCNHKMYWHEPFCEKTMRQNGLEIKCSCVAFVFERTPVCSHCGKQILRKEIAVDIVWRSKRQLLFCSDGCLLEWNKAMPAAFPDSHRSGTPT
jgi:hypothetical protein